MKRNYFFWKILILPPMCFPSNCIHCQQYCATQILGMTLQEKKFDLIIIIIKSTTDMHLCSKKINFHGRPPLIFSKIQMKIQQSTISYSPIEKINVTRVASGSNCAKILFTTKLSTTLQDLFQLSFGYTAGRKFKKKSKQKNS